MARGDPVGVGDVLPSLTPRSLAARSPAFPFRNHAAGCLLVALAPVLRDLLPRAKYLFVAGIGRAAELAGAGHAVGAGRFWAIGAALDSKDIGPEARRLLWGVIG
jgi:hypothetical protein